VESEEQSEAPLGLEMAVSDPSQMAALRNWLDGQPDVEVTVTPGVPGPGEQGALDVLSVLAGSSGLITAIKVIPEFIRSRRAGFRIETTVRGERFVLDATNVKDVLPVIERLLSE
jgi:hypothetical protein